jgi:DNA-binding NarL/FixJ family response regulator
MIKMLCGLTPDPVLGRHRPMKPASRPAAAPQLTRRLGEIVGEDRSDRARALSPREREVLALVAQGLNNREIAEQLAIAPATARNHVSNLLAKLGMSRRSEAAATAAAAGLTHSHD